jgi:hypothetical protein
MNTILTIVLTLLLAVFVASVAMAADHSFAYGPAISPSDPSERMSSEMSLSAADHSNAVGGQVLYGLSISPSDPSEGALLEHLAGYDMFFTAEDNSYTVEGKKVCGLSISPADPSEGLSGAKQC